MSMNVPRESETSVTSLPPARIRSAPTLALVQRVTMEADFTVTVKLNLVVLSLSILNTVPTQVLLTISY